MNKIDQSLLDQAHEWVGVNHPELEGDEYVAMCQRTYDDLVELQEERQEVFTGKM